jgi:RimJ/RimL family protein N-acetyltransferase
MFDLPEGYSSGLLGVGDLAELIVLQNSCAKFFQLVYGRSPTRADAEELLADRPEGLPLEDKRLIAIRKDDQLIGVLDLLSNYPQVDSWYLGLLMLDSAYRGQGIGAAICEATFDWIARQGGRDLTLIVQEQNPAARRFWSRIGFRPIGDAAQSLDGGRQNTVTRMMRPLVGGSPRAFQ